MEKKKVSLRKKIIIASSVVVILVFGVIFTGYMVIQNYIHKMNLVSAQSKETVVDSQSKEEVEIETLGELEPGKDGQVTDEQELIEGAELAEEAGSEASLTAEDSPDHEINTLENEIQKNLEDNSTTVIESEEVFHILLVGIDSRKSGGTGRSDAMIIVSINNKKKTITATSLLRDIYLQIPGKKNNRINTAYSYGGAELLMETIEKNFKIKIDRYVSVDFFAFIDIVDAVGGVTLEVSEKEIPVINNYVAEINKLTGKEETKDQLSEEGVLLLNGKQALGYSRNRYVGNNDFERTNRQRRVLEQIFMEVKDLNLIKLNGLLNIILPQVTTNLTEGELFSLILSLPKYRGYDLQQWRVPMNGSYSNLRIRGMQVLGIDFEDNIEEIQKRIYGDD